MTVGDQRSAAGIEALEPDFEVIRELGRGGMAVVYQARDRVTGTEVAIKLIRAKYQEDEEAIARFAREARLVARLQHPRIVPVHAIRQLDDNSLAIVMEMVPGRTLRELIRRRGPLTYDRATSVLCDIAEALGYAHSQGIVHRDVKPENVFLHDATGRAYLSDFGIARTMDSDTNLTVTGVAIGTPTYMSPEQIDGTSLDGRSDIYSLGLVGWEMLSGRRPWDGESLYSVIYRQKHDRLPSLELLCPGIPESLLTAVEVAIEKSPASRWPDAEAFIDQLSVSQAMRPRNREQPTPVPGANETVSFVRPLDEAPRRRRWATPLLVLMLLAGLGAAAWTVMPELRAMLRNPLALVFPRRATPAVPSAPDTLVDTTAISPPPLSTAPVGEVRDTATKLAGGAKASAPPGQTAVSASAGVTVAAADDSTRSGARADGAPRSGNSGLDSKQSVPIDVAAKPKADSKAPPTEKTKSTAARSSAAAAAAAATPAAASTATASAPSTGNAPAAAAPPGASGAPTDASSAAGGRDLVVGRLADHTVIAGGGVHTCLITPDFVPYCWGGNDQGQLGDGVTARSATPVRVQGDLRVSMVAPGISHTCAVARSGDGYCWGGNEHGQVGDGSTVRRLSPVPIAGGKMWRGIWAGASHSCGLTKSGDAYCWGANTHGQLGTGDMNDQSTPQRVSGGNRFVIIAPGWGHTCALTAAGAAFCWGENSAGELGDGSSTDRAIPVAVSGGHRFVDIAAGSSHSCGVTDTGEVYCWGRNAAGQLGDGTTNDHPTPVKIAKGEPYMYVAVAAGGVHSCALARNGVAYCWGRNAYGQLGDDETADSPVPVAVAGGHYFNSIQAVGAHTCASTNTGESFCWGYNVEGQLGDGTRAQRARPIYIERPTS